MPLSEFSAVIVHDAISTAARNYAMPPSIKDFLSLCEQASRRLPVLEDKNKKTKNPPSVKLAEYMAKNPVDPEIKMMLQKYSGKELGEQMIKLVKVRLGSSVKMHFKASR